MGVPPIPECKMISIIERTSMWNDSTRGISARTGKNQYFRKKRPQKKNITRWFAPILTTNFTFLHTILPVYGTRAFHTFVVGFSKGN